MLCHCVHFTLKGTTGFLDAKERDAENDRKRAVLQDPKPKVHTWGKAGNKPLLNHHYYYYYHYYYHHYYNHAVRFNEASCDKDLLRCYMCDLNQLNV